MNGSGENLGPSDFDVRHSFSAGVTYNIPAPRVHSLALAILRDWSIDSIVLVRSATPVNLFNSSLAGLANGFGFSNAAVRPDIVPGVPLLISDSSVAGGKRINPAAFTDPPIDPTTGLPLRQGTLGRNALRGFGASQWDFDIRRQFSIREGLHLQFRAEFFNLLNHPNFANPIADLSSPLFGRSTQMLGRSLAGFAGVGGFDSIFQVGGPRSVQLALKLEF